MILFSRVLAFVIDYLVLAVYGGAVFAFAIFLQLDAKVSSPWISHLLGFLSLTLPVVLYFIVCENSAKQATYGKLVCRLKVMDISLNAASFRSLCVRNCLKFLPWEIAHLGVHWAFYYNRMGVSPASWVWIPLILAQMLAIIYLIGIAMTKTNQAPYEIYSGTCVKQVNGSR